MKTLTTLVAAAISLSAVGWCVMLLAHPRGRADAADHRPDTPRVFLEATQVDLGTVSADRPAVARVRIRNDGRRRLIVHHEGGSCCGQADEAIIVGPGDSAVVQTTINTAALRGPVHRTTTFFTNDPALPRFEVTVSADVIAAGDSLTEK